MTMYIECDSACEVYVDGEVQATLTSASGQTSLEIPLFAQLLAIQGKPNSL